MRRAPLALVAVLACASFACRRAPHKERLRSGRAPVRPDAGTVVAPTALQAQAPRPPTAPPPTPDAGPPAPPPEPPVMVKLTIKSIPPKMKVYWGRKLLGETPVIVPRPLDSGPMDLVFKLDGYFPLHVRAYTYKSDTVVMKATKLTDRMKLLGAKQDLLPEGGTPDGGVPAEAPVVPPLPSAPPLPPAAPAPKVP